MKRIKKWWYDFRHRPVPIQWMTFIYWKEGDEIMGAITMNPMRYAQRHKIQKWSMRIGDLVVR